MKKLSLVAALVGFGFVGTGCGVGTEADGADVVGEQRDPLYLGSTTDQCSSVLHVLNAAGVYQTIQRGHWTRVNVNDRQFRWKCGTTLEQTTCNIGTNWVNVYHSTTSREITWQCNS